MIRMANVPKAALPRLSQAVHALPSKLINPERQTPHHHIMGLQCIPSYLFMYVCSGRARLLNLRCMDWYKPFVQTGQTNLSKSCYAASVMSTPGVETAISAPSSMRVCFLAYQNGQHRCSWHKAQIMCTSDMECLQVCRVCKAQASIPLWLEASSFRHTPAWRV